MNITLIITGLQKAGAETQVVELAKKLKKRSHNISIICLLKPIAFLEELAEDKIVVESLLLNKQFPNPAVIVRLLKHTYRCGPDIIHSHMVHANILARIVKIFVRKPRLICTAHSINEGGLLRTLAYRYTDFLCDLTTNVSKVGVDLSISAKKVPPHKIIFVPNGIDASKFTFNDAARNIIGSALGLVNNFLFLAIGRFEPAKDYVNLLHAFRKVVDNNNTSVLLIAGDGALRVEIDRLAHQLLLSDRIYFLGVRTDICDLLSAADAYVMSSAWEGMPMVLLEAASVGLPIVATDVGGNNGIVIEGESGFLVPPKDPDALAAAMLRVMALPEESRQAMGRAGRAHVVANYALDHVVDQWEKIYQDLLNK